MRVRAYGARSACERGRNGNVEIVAAESASAAGHDDVGKLPDARGEVRCGLSLADFPQLASPLARYCRSHRIRETQRCCPRTRRIREHVQVGERKRFDKGYRRAMISVGLAGKTSDDIGAEPEHGQTLRHSQSRSLV